MPLATQQGLIFNGVSDCVHVATSSIFTVSAVSLELWTNPSANQGNSGSVLHKERQYTVGISANGVIKWADTNNWVWKTNPDWICNPNTENHIVVTSDGSSAVICYVNGVQKSTLVQASNFGAGTGLPLGIGDNGQKAGLYLGSISTARVYNRALTPYEVSLNYAGRPVRDSSLVGEWLFSEGQGTVAHDTSGNGNDGTLTGCRWATESQTQGLRLDGYAGAVVTDSTSLQITADFAIDAVIQPYAYPNVQNRILDKNGGNYAFGVDGNGIYFWSPGNAWQKVSTYVPPFYQDTKVTLSKIGNTAYCYINGVLNNTVAMANFSATFAGNLYIGGGGSSGKNWVGLIKSLRIYNRGLQPSEVGAAAPIRQGLVGEWLFQGNMKDTSGLGNDAAIPTIGGRLLEAGAARTIQSSKGLQFTGIGDVAVPFTLPAVGSMEWVYTPSRLYNYNEMWSNSAGADVWESWIYQNSIIAARIAGSNYATSPVHALAGTRYHMVFTWDANNNVQLYVNGQTSGPVSNPAQAAGSMIYLGGGPQTTNSYGEGVMEYFRIYNRVLTPDEASTEVKKGGLVLDYDMAAVNGTIPDLTGNGHDATFSGCVPLVKKPAR